MDANQQNNASANSQLKKGFLDLFVLLAIYQKPIYPNEIMSTLDHAGIKISEGTLYPLLTRLKNEQYLTYKWQESTSGPPRKYFQITSAGKKLIKLRIEAFREMQNVLQSLLKTNNLDD